MANSTQTNQEYLLVKCFVYKYTPPFDGPTKVEGDLSTFKRFTIPLDDTKYFTKYDISPFVTSYSFDQNINETAYSWSVELQDLTLSYGTINTKLKVPAPLGSTLTNGLSFASNTDSLNLLTEYETNANTFENNDPQLPDSTTPIQKAKYYRGHTPGPMTVQGTNTPPTSNINGLKLSDLIQEYDFISLFLYKSTTPLTDIYGTVVPDGFSPINNMSYVFNYKFTSSDQVSFANAFSTANYQTLTDANLQYETILLTKMPHGKTLFSNEFNGFAMRKNISSSIGQVDRVTISGNGWSRLFGSTRRVVKPSLFQNSLYQAGQVLGLDAMTALQDVYAGKSVAEIVQDLFDLVYKINFKQKFTNITELNSTVAAGSSSSTNGTNLVVKTTTPSPVSAFAPSPFFPFNSLAPIPGISSQATAFTNPLTTTSVSVSVVSTNPDQLQGVNTNTPQISSTLVLGNSFFNITALLVANSYPANLFNLPQYLLATVMKIRPFAYIEPINVPVSQSFIDGAILSAAKITATSTLQLPSQQGTGFQAASQASAVATAKQRHIPSLTFDIAMTDYNVNSQVINYDDVNPVFIEPELQSLQLYFQYLEQVFKPFSPDLKTPYEILEEIRTKTFIELFEQPNGQFLIRSPQYNNMTISTTGRPDIALIRSSGLNIMSRVYTESVENLVSRVVTGNAANMLPNIPGVEQFAYVDGKLLVQNGLTEMVTSANPNINNKSSTNNSANDGSKNGTFGYVEYLMELSNARLKTGSITCDLDNTVQVGQTFIDENKYKFGYIVGVNKKVQIGGSATMSLNLSYVRDAYPTIASDGALVNIDVDLLPVLSDIEISF